MGGEVQSDHVAFGEDGTQMSVERQAVEETTEVSRDGDAAHAARAACTRSARGPEFRVCLSVCLPVMHAKKGPSVSYWFR
jgi:hypothetical protein